MPTTRRRERHGFESDPPVHTGKKRSAKQYKDGGTEERATKRTKPDPETSTKGTQVHVPSKDYPRQTGAIERGHIYFFYRPRVQQQEAHSLDDVRNLQMLLVPRPPGFSTDVQSNVHQEQDEGSEMTLLAPGSYAVPAKQPLDQPKKHFRLITVGKKQLPDPEGHSGGTKRKETFWAVITRVGDDLGSLENGLGEKTYETKTRGTRHEEPARLAARGAYAIVNNNPRIPSESVTHLGYHLSHPAKLSDVQNSLGISKASSFVLQVKNPLAPATGAQRVGLPLGRTAKYPDKILNQVFGKGIRGRESYGLRFTSCERTELLDYEGAELLLIAARDGEDGLEQSLGEGRGEALGDFERKEGRVSINDVFRELALDKDVFPAEPLKGEWI